MKKILIIIVAVFSINEFVVAQQTNPKIWQITADYLKSQNEIPAQNNIFPQKNKDEVVIPFYIFFNNQLLDDPDYTLPTSNVMQLFRFSSLRVHATYYLLISINGYWDILDMKKTLSEIIIDGGKICDSLALDEDQSILFIREVLEIYQYNMTK